MKLNPLTALTDSLEKLINEHGSAAILREHVSLLKSQASIFEQKVIDLETENATLKTKIENLESEMQKLKLINGQQKNKIQEYEKLAAGHSSILDETKIKIMKYLSKQSSRVLSNQVANSLAIELHIAIFHLEELATKKNSRFHIQF